MVLGNTTAVIAADNGPTVGVIKPMRKTVSAKLAIPANVVPYEQAEIHAKASGYVKKVLVDIGDRVNPGQILAELDLPEMAMEMKVVEAELRKAQAMFLEASQADKLKAQANLENCKRRSTCRTSIFGGWSSFSKTRPTRKPSSRRPRETSRRPRQISCWPRRN
ncbi:MAG: biotin/lipoyl-binding protein [Opitutales bacterium]